jgi:hypothetical protein
VAVPQYFQEATLVNIARLRYRPHTERTSQWFKRVAELGTEYLETYGRMIADFAPVHAKGVAA